MSAPRQLYGFNFRGVEIFKFRSHRIWVEGTVDYLKIIERHTISATDPR